MKASGSSALLAQGGDSAGYVSPRGGNRTLLSSKQEEVFVRPSQGAGSADFNVHKKDPRGQKIREGWVQKWHTKKSKVYNQRYLILWENKELVYYNSKPYNVRSPYKGIWRLTPAGSLFLLQDDENDMSCCFQLSQDGVACRFACASDEERDWWVTPMLHMGLRLVLGPGLGESINVKNLLQTLPEIQRHIQLIPDMQKEKLALEQSKRAAIESEDFDLAKQLKAEIETLTPKLRQLEQIGSLVDLYRQALPFSLADVVEEIAMASDFVRRREEHERRLQEEKNALRPNENDGPDPEILASQLARSSTPERSKSPKLQPIKGGLFDNLRLSASSGDPDVAYEGRDSLGSISPQLMSLYAPTTLHSFPKRANSDILTPNSNNKAAALASPTSISFSCPTNNLGTSSNNTNNNTNNNNNTNTNTNNNNNTGTNSSFSVSPRAPSSSSVSSACSSSQSHSSSSSSSGGSAGSNIESKNGHPQLVRCGSLGFLNSSKSNSIFSSPKLGSPHGVYFSSPKSVAAASSSCSSSPPSCSLPRSSSSMLPHSNNGSDSRDGLKLTRQGSLSSLSDSHERENSLVFFPGEFDDEGEGTDEKTRVAHVRSQSDYVAQQIERGSGIFASLFGGSKSGNNSEKFGRARSSDIAVTNHTTEPSKNESRGSVNKLWGEGISYSGSERGDGSGKRGSAIEKGYRSEGEVGSNSRKPASPVLALGKARKEEEEHAKSVYRKDKKGFSQSLKFDTRTMNPEDDDFEKVHRRPKTNAFFKSRDDSEKESSEVRDAAAINFSRQMRDEELLRRFAQVRDRKKKLRTHLHCFVGKEAVTSLVTNGAVSTRDEGVALGNRLILAGVIIHVTKPTAEFRDKDSLYRFASHR